MGVLGAGQSEATTGSRVFDDAGRGPLLLYVCGSTRLGAAMLERVIASAPSVFGMGELQELWRRPRGAQMCSCRRPLGECGFWSDVLTSAGIDDAWLAEMAELQRAIGAPAAHFNLTALRTAPAAVEFNARLSALLAAVRDVSGKQILVDTSRDPARAWSLAAGREATAFLHFYSGARHVLASTRPRKDEPPAPHRGRILRESAAWVRTEKAMRKLGEVATVRRLDYTALVDNPRSSLKLVFNSIAPGLQDEIRWTSEDSVTEAPDHHGLGGGDRTERGAVRIRYRTAFRDIRGLDRTACRVLGDRLSAIWS